MKKNLTLLILGLLVAAALAAVVCPQLANRPVNAPRAQTKLEISQMYLCMLQVEHTGGIPIVEILDKTFPGQQNNYNRKLAEFLKENGIQLRYGKTQTGDLVMLDVWGHPFHVCLREQGLKLGLPTDLLGDKKVIIWSSGPNGVDNLGRGDDVFWQDPNR